MPLGSTRFGGGSFSPNSVIDAANPLVPTSVGVNASGSVQVTGVILLAALLLVVAIARSMGG